MKCVGGSAKGEFVPEVVQCYNRGSDGYDVQVRNLTKYLLLDIYIVPILISIS